MSAVDDIDKACRILLKNIIIMKEEEFDNFNNENPTLALDLSDFKVINLVDTRKIKDDGYSYMVSTINKYIRKHPSTFALFGLKVDQDIFFYLNNPILIINGKKSAWLYM